MVLMYHRVVNLRHDPWGIAVTPENFREHVRILASFRQVVPLSVLLREVSLVKGKGMVAITFDDAYVDVFDNALPILSEFDCPATVFVVPGMLGDKRGYWWDVLTRIIFDPPELPPELELPKRQSGDGFTWRGRNGPTDEQSRRSLYYALWRRLHEVGKCAREEWLGTLAEWAGVTPQLNPSDCAMGVEQAAAVARLELVDIGAHTMTHPSLPTLSRDDQLAEMRESRKACEDIAGRRIVNFAYPFGDHNADSVWAAAEAGFSAAFTTKAGMMSRGRDPLRLPRMNIGNYSPERFRRALRLNFAFPESLPLSLSAKLT